MNNVLQYLTYLNVGFAIFLIIILIVLLLEVITRIISQRLNNFDWFRSFNYWLYNNHIIGNISYYITIIVGLLFLILFLIEMGKMTLGH